MVAEIGTPAPAFTLTSSTFEQVSLDDYRGRPLVLVFVPMAFSPTCEGEYRTIRDNYRTFRDVGAAVVGISVDSKWALKAWAEQQNLPFALLADFHPKGAVARAYGVWNEEAGYADRGSFVIDADGIVREIIRSAGLKVPRDLDSYEHALSTLTAPAEPEPED